MLGEQLNRFKLLPVWVKNNRLPFLLLLSTLILAGSPLRILCFFILLYAIARLLPIPFGLLGKIVVAFLLFSCSLSILASVAWLQNFPLSSGLIFGLHVIVIFIVWALFGFKGPILSPKKELLNTHDLAAFATAIMAMVVVILPIGHTFNVSALASVIMTGGDNSAHLEMMKVTDLNRGFSIGTGNRVDMLRNHMAYPQGWHLSGSLIKWTVETLVPIGTSPLRILALYYAISVVWFGLLIFMIVRLSLYLLALSTPRPASFSVIASVSVASTGIAGWIFSLFEFGFQTHLAALTLLLTQLLFLSHGYKSRLNDRYKYFLGALLFVSGVSFFWYFLLPVSLVITLVCILQTLISNRKTPPPYFIVGSIILFCFILFQPWVQSAFATGIATADSAINLRGNVIHTSMYPLITLSLILGVYQYLRYRSLQLRVFYMSSVIALGFSLLLMFYQLSTIQELRYYYFKSNYTFITLAIIMLAALIGDFSQQILRKSPIKNNHLHNAIISVALILIGSVGFWTFKSSAFDDFLHNRMGGVSASQANAISDVMSKNTEAGVYILPIGSCNRGDDIRAAQLAHALLYSPATAGPSVYGSLELSYLNKHYLYKAITKYVNSHENLIIVSSDQVVSNELQRALGTLTAKTTFIELDTTPETEPVAQCPDRVRDLTENEKATGVL